MEKMFRVVLAVYQPAVEINFNDPEKRSQIDDAQKANNIRFDGFKMISVMDVTKSTIALLLKIVVPDNVSVNVSREVSYFSKRLYHDYGWKGLSKVPKRLFTVVEAVEVNETPTSDTLIEHRQITQNVLPTALSLEDENYKKIRLKWLLATKELIEFEINMLKGEKR